VTLLDTGPLVALFDPRDPAHQRARRALKAERTSLCTTIPVLTEAFHLLAPGSRGSRALRSFVAASGLGVWFLDLRGVARAFELMETYADHPMDLADASLVVAAERLGTRRIVTLDRSDFTTYRMRRGHRRLAFQVVHC
jgi:predicted nucleic acid-binding protein